MHKLKEVFDVESKHGAFYTGGNVEWHDNILYCKGISTVSLFNIDNGSVSSLIGEEGEDADEIQTFTCNNKRIVTSHKSGLFKLWNEEGNVIKMWKYIHKGPVARLTLLENVLASGGSDGIIRIWELEHQACIYGLKGAQGVIHVVEFYQEKNCIFGSGDDGKIHLWGLEKGQLLRSFNGHFSKVTSIAFHHDKKHFISAGRDKVIILWDSNKEKYLKVIPVYEAVESVISLPHKFQLPDLIIDEKEGIHVAIAGELGIVRIWDVLKSKELFRQSNSLVDKAKDEGGLSITKLIFDSIRNIFGVVTADQNILLHNSSDFSCVKQFVGFSDEILDAIYVGKEDEFIAVATNSCDVKLYEDATMNCQLLKGHTDIVLSLSKCMANRNLFASSGKDNSVRLWLLDGRTATFISEVKTHTASVGSVAFSNLASSFLVSASQDTCLKVWKVPDKLMVGEKLVCLKTQIAHERDINSVTVSPNDKMLATASQDKTAKLWSTDLELLGTLRGHKRGVWCARFSPVDQVVLTSSADCTVKLWSTAELNCLKTIEGHEASVLRAEFITNGLQILTAGADGLLKLFNLKTSECSLTLDQHQARIWALALKTDESGFLTGGSDSLLIKWKDVTVQNREEKKKREEELTLQEQIMSNYVHEGKYLKALSLALELNRPLQTLRIIQAVLKEADQSLKSTVEQLRDEQKELLLNCALEWNTNSRFCQEAQLVINILLEEIQSGRCKISGLGKIVESALPYTERHFKRLTQLLQDLHFIKYTVKCIEPHTTIK
ncbi:transducin beta-like protein 3 [Agrilus planipennis]|uniref:Transducin beta-like protein 3 n=1 Tax=Agrilus planipennis TaxID=224129 RepID=A0A1W4XAA9_AGRPL|nr:transducin beta-like protein 3 [Agrilus planipennis]